MTKTNHRRKSCPAAAAKRCLAAHRVTPISRSRPPLIRESFQVVVQCASEADQRSLYDRLTAEGRHCRLLLM